MRSTAAKTDTTSHAGPQQQQYPALKVLVAEDNPVNQQVIAGLLRAHGIEAELCGNGVEAVDRVVHSQHGYDLILMDGQMPELNGFEASLQIRATPNIRQPLIAALTAHALDEFRQRANASGMDFYLTKPLRRQDISDLLKDVSQKRQSN
jgi:CheY-like chemotaxis protein